MVVKDLAEKMGISATELISELIKNGVFASVNEEIDFETASIIADDFGFKISSLLPPASSAALYELELLSVPARQLYIPFSQGT